MNPGLKLILMIILVLEISFIENLSLNVVIIIICLIYLLKKRPSNKQLVGLFLGPLIPAVGIFLSQMFYGNGGSLLAGVFATRIYAYVFLGACFTFSTNMTDLMKALEQSFHVPAKFVYGILSAFNLLPKVIQQIKVIRTASLMRGVKINFWSPKIYFKAILSALQWSQNLAEAMESHGFVEDQPRSQYHPIRLTQRDWGQFFAILVVFQGLVLILNSKFL